MGSERFTQQEQCRGVLGWFNPKRGERSLFSLYFKKARVYFSPSTHSSASPRGEFLFFLFYASS
jgi:hypothetical protein